MQQSARLILSDVSATGIELCKWATWLGLRVPSAMGVLVRANDEEYYGIGRIVVNMTDRHAPFSLMRAQCVACTQDPQIGIRVLAPMR